MSFFQLTKAETALLDITKSLDNAEDKGKPIDQSKLRQLSDDFYLALPHNNQCKIQLNSKKLVSNKHDLCQVRFYCLVYEILRYDLLTILVDVMYIWHEFASCGAKICCRFAQNLTF